MVQQRVLNNWPADDLSVLVVWTPVLPSDTRDSVETARSSVPDSRARHYWDPNQTLAKHYGAALDLPRGDLAWDVYLLFDKSANWASRAPEPSHWWHQLAFDDRYLRDGDAILEALSAAHDGR